MRVYRTLVERGIELLAKELGIKEEHIRSVFNGDYEGVWVVHITTEQSFQLLAKKTGERKYAKLKKVRGWKKEEVEKMQRLARLVKLYRSLRTLEELNLEHELELLSRRLEALATFSKRTSSGDRKNESTIRQKTEIPCHLSP